MIGLKRKVVTLAISAFALLGMSIAFVDAVSVSAVLHTDEKSAHTAILGNTTGKYRMVGALSTTSKYSVDYYLYKGKDGNSCNVLNNCFSYSKSSAFDKTFSIDKSQYTLARCYMYGNTKKNQKTSCYANVILSNK